MPRLTVFNQLEIPELIEKYELCVTTIANLHEDLTHATGDLHVSYLDHFQTSDGKSVAEKNRDADNATKHEYREVIAIRGRINRLSEQRDLLVNLLNWKMRLRSNVRPDLSETYPADRDKDVIGRV